MRVAALGIQLTLYTAAGYLSARETTRIVHAVANRNHETTLLARSKEGLSRGNEHMKLRTKYMYYCLISTENYFE